MPEIHGRRLTEEKASYYEFLAQDFPRQRKYAEPYGRMIASLLASSHTEDGRFVTTMGYVALADTADVPYNQAARFMDRLEKAGILVRIRRLWYPYSDRWRYQRAFDPTRTKRLKQAKG